MSDKNLPTQLFTPRTFQEAREFAQFVSKTNFVPKDYKDKPDEILACIQYGSEVGLSPMQALQSIAVINGRPSLFGDASLALVMASGLLEYIEETEEGDTAICEVKRKGYPEPHIVKWSAADTATAGLANREVHKAYPRRMRQNRARGFCLRDVFPDVLKGLISEDEAIDVTPPKADLSPGVKLEHDLPPPIPQSEWTPEEAAQVAALQQAEINRRRNVDADGLKEAEAGGTSLGLLGGHRRDAQLPVADGEDYPTAEEVMGVYRTHTNAKAAMEIIRKHIPDLTQRGGFNDTTITGPERKKVMEALRK